MADQYLDFSPVRNLEFVLFQATKFGVVML